MYDINLKNVKKGKRFYGIFLFIGLIFLFILLAIIVGSIVNRNSLDSSVMSYDYDVKEYYDSEDGTMYKPIYYYKVDDKEYECVSSVSSSFNNYDNKTVYYDSNNPSRCMTTDANNSIYFLAIFLIIPVVFIAVGYNGIAKVDKRIKIITELNNNGKLIKGIPYHMENTGMSVNDVQIQRPVIDYKLPNGSVIQLYGDPRHDGKYKDEDGLVDLVIDEVDTDKYFIDFEINRLSGNRSEDYYQDNNEVSQEDRQFEQEITQFEDNTNSFGSDDLFN